MTLNEEKGLSLPFPNQSACESRGERDRARSALPFTLQHFLSISHAQSLFTFLPSPLRHSRQRKLVTALAYVTAIAA